MNHLGPPSSTLVPPPPPPTLSSAVSSLTNLLNLSSTTPSPRELLPCPFNPNHHIPPSSLFSHSLLCSNSSPHQTLKYPHTLNSTNPFTLPYNSDLCFSLEPYLPTHPYSDSPAVVSFPLTHSPPFLTLPPLLSSHCANFPHDSSLENENIQLHILPSHIHAITREIDTWHDYPFTYSYSILRVIISLGVTTARSFSLSDWMITESARCYGIVLDLAMSEHILVLFNLCLKAIVEEASQFYNEDSVSFNQRFNCPVLVQVLMWLATQLSVLYGEMNGKLFAINMLKQCVREFALSSCMFVENSDTRKGDDNLGEPQKARVENMGKNESDKTLFKTPIYVSQVAAAVAALHERSMLEQHFIALRNYPLLPAYQRKMEHAYLSNIAEEERRKRPNYRALIEHDGLLWRHSRDNQDPNRTKTKEELLAEERDYKRRRMSYRGKKLKRSTTQVMRDIIDEYMDELTQSGATNGTPKRAEETDCPLSTNYRMDIEKADSGKRQLDSYALRKAREVDMKKFHTDGDVHSPRIRDYNSENKERASQWPHRHSVAERSNGVSRQGRKDYSRRLNSHDSSGYSRETLSPEKREYPKDSKDDISRSSSKSYHRSVERSSSRRERTDYNSDSKKWKSRDASDDFGDRYDPSK